MNTPFYFPWNVVTASLVGAVSDADGIKTSIATSASVATYTTFNGALGGSFVLARNVSVTSTTHSGTYNIVDPIVFTGTDANGSVITESLYLTLVNGNETIYGVKGFKTVTSIAVPAQVDTLGTFTFGVQHAFISDQCVGLRIGTGGNVKVTYSNGTVDTVPFASAEFLNISPVKIWGTSATTATDIVSFLKK